MTVSPSEPILKDRLKIRKADISECYIITDFFDKHLHNLYHDPGFVPFGLIQDKIKRGNVWVAEIDSKLVGVAISNGKTLWNLVVHKDFRYRCVGSSLLKHINPEFIRIKCKGGLPDPTVFYEKNGYKPLQFVRSNVTKKKTILLAVKEK